ncbi:MAG: hypothetical protein A2W80_19490 [Candidatus Riflebacteria bacterium GWC2_50_8]|nr:MAG: hypothetical protein A2W80_19490 [Candidatus Riflebacteria bacterium GWC2_50_8]
MKWAKIAALVIACGCATLAFVAWRGMLTMRQGMADCLNWQGKSLAERFIIDDARNRELVAEVSGFAQRVTDGTQPAMSGFAVLRSFYDGPLLLALLHTSLANHVRTIATTEEIDLQDVEKVSLQFFTGVSNGKVATADWQKVRGLLMEQKICETESSIGFVIPEQVESFRRKIGQKALFDCIAIMQQAGSKTDPVASQTVLDPVAELKKILASAH